MKLFKKSVSLFLALLMIFGSVSLLATAAEAEFNWSVDTKFYRYDGAEWIETTKAAKGEKVKARVFLETDFVLYAASFLYFYSSEFLTFNPEGYPAGTAMGSYALTVNNGIYTGNIRDGYGYDDNLFGDMVYDGYMSEEDIADKSWLMLGSVKPKVKTQFDGEDWFFEMDFIVNEEPTGNGQFYMSVQCISDYDNWCAPTVIEADVDGDVYVSCDEPTGTFAYNLNDTDVDSSLSCDNTVVFTATEGSVEGTASYTGFIGDKLSSIAGFSLPTASAEGKQFLGWSTDGKTALTEDQVKELTIGYEPLTLTAVYQAANASYKQNVYTMGIDGNYGDAVSTDIGSTPGTKVKASDYSVPAGFTLDAEKSTAGEVEVNAEGTATLDIYLKRNQYNATFGTTVIPVYYGAEYAAPAGENTETGIFEYWVNADDESVVLKAGDTATMGLADVTYIAKYKAVYNVTYAFAGAAPDVDLSSYQKANANIGDEIVLPEMEAAGWTFLGWTVEGAEESEGVYTVGTTDVTVTGEWVKNTYVVNYWLDDAMSEIYFSEEYSFGDDVEVPEDPTDDVLPEPGYTFLGWGQDVIDVIDADTVDTYFEPDPDVAGRYVYDNVASISPVEYTVTVYYIGVPEYEGEEVGMLEGYLYGDELLEEDLPDPSEIEGYNFMGWKIDDETPIFPYTVTGDVTIEGYFEIQKFNATFYANGGAWLNGDTKKTVEVAYGEQIPDMELPVREGYHLDEEMPWGVELGEMFDEPQEFYAEWIANKYTITFVVEGEEFETSQDYEANIQLPDFGKDLATAKPGYEFKGWTTDGGATVIADITTVTVPLDGETYTAVYKPAAGGVDYKVERYFMNTNGNYDGVEADVVTIDGVTAGTQVTYDVEVEGFTLDTAAGKLSDTVAGDGSTVLTAYYIRNTVKVTINGEEGEKYYGEEITEDDMPKHPTAPEGMEPDGWVDGNDEPVEFPVKVGTEDIVINPNYKASEFLITFMNGDETVQSGKQTFGEVLVIPADVNVPGYTFDGWYADGVKVEAGVTTVPSKATTYTAKLTPAENTAYTVKTYVMNIDGSTYAESSETKYDVTDTLINYTPEEKTGFTVEDRSVLTGTVTGDGLMTIEVYYSRNKLTVTIDGEPDEYFYGETIEEMDTPEADEGYTFDGWVDGDNNPVNFPITVEKDMVITPVFTANTVSLSFEADGMTVEGYPVDAKVDSDITAPTAPEKEGYNFVGWYIKGTNIAFNGKMPTTDTVYEAIYTAGANTKVSIEIYTMNTDGKTYSMTVAYTYGVTGTTTWVEPNEDLPGFTPNLEKSHLSDTVATDGSTVLAIYYDRDVYRVTWDVDGTVETTDVYYGAEIIAPAEPKKDGYVFAGWTPEVPATMPEGDLAFAATWAEDVYTVTYIVNGEKTTETYAYGATVTVKEAPEAEGMTFNGWFDGDTEYVPGATFEMPAKDIIIVADFAVAIFKVTYLNADGSVFTTEMVRYGDEIPVPEDKPVKDHYEFVEWNIVYDAMPDHDIEVEPIFERIAVKLIAKDGSTTQIDRDNFVITGLREYLKEDVLRSTYLDVEGDGFFTVTPSVSDYCGTGAKVELYDNLDPSEPIETYIIVIYGDIDGDSLATAVDSTWADDEGLMLTSWSDDTAPDYDPYKVMAADLNGDDIIDAIDAQIIGNVSIGMLRINQVTGTPS